MEFINKTSKVSENIFQYLDYAACFCMALLFSGFIDICIRRIHCYFQYIVLYSKNLNFQLIDLIFIFSELIFIFNEVFSLLLNYRPTNGANVFGFRNVLLNHVLFLYRSCANEQYYSRGIFNVYLYLILRKIHDSLDSKNNQSISKTRQSFVIERDF